MKNFFKNLAVRVKLLYSFLLLASFVLAIGLTAIVLQKSLNKNQAKTLSGINLSDAFFEAKYFMRSDMHIFTQLMETQTKERLNYWWGEHEFQVIFFNDQLSKIETEFSKNEHFGTNQLMERVLDNNQQIKEQYDNDLLPLFNRFKGLKTQEIELMGRINQSDSITQEQLNIQAQIAALSLQYKDLNAKISASGLNIITDLDTGKDMVRVEINSIIEKGNYMLKRTQKIFIILTILGLLFSLFISFYITKLISHPVTRILNHVNLLGKGILPEQFVIRFKDEFGKIQEALNNLTASLSKTSVFAKEIGEGNFDSEFEPMSEKDILGNSLLDMRTSLRKARLEEDKRRKEDEQRSWTASGLTKFGDIMRQSSDDYDKLAYELISKLTDYVGAVQGALFVINEEEEEEVHFELASAIAYNRKKLLHRKIKMGEGLIGRAAYEEKTIYLKEVPDDYISITSGLGTANPNCILLVPVQIDQKVNGVIELVSFKEFDDFQINFIERVAESISSFITNVRINEKTASLLKDSQLKSEELSAQEEEMRQNLEELQATQEEAARRESEGNQLWASLGKLQGIIECDMQGTITNINDKTASLVGMDQDLLIGSNYKNTFFENNPDQAESIWEMVQSGQTQAFETPWNHQGVEKSLQHQLTLVNDTDGMPLKILVILQE